MLFSNNKDEDKIMICLYLEHESSQCFNFLSSFKVHTNTFVSYIKNNFKSNSSIFWSVIQNDKLIKLEGMTRDEAVSL